MSPAGERRQSCSLATKPADRREHRQAAGVVNKDNLTTTKPELFLRRGNFMPHARARARRYHPLRTMGRQYPASGSANRRRRSAASETLDPRPRRHGPTCRPAGPLLRLERMAAAEVLGNFLHGYPLDSRVGIDVADQSLKHEQHLRSA
jgi:hypothetical protein